MFQTRFLSPDAPPAEAAPAAPAAAPEPVKGPLALPERQAPPDLRTPIEKRMAEVRQNIADGKIAYGGEPEALKREAARDEKGKFISPDVAEGAASEAAEALDGGAAPDAGTEGDGAELEPGQDDAGQADPTLLVQLPGRSPGDEGPVIQVDDKATADGLRRLRNGYMRGEEARRQLESVAEERRAQEFFRERVELDPVGLVLENTTPEARLAIARNLIVMPEVLEALADELHIVMSDPQAREQLQTKLENAQLKNRDKVAAEFQKRDMGRKIAASVTNSVDRLTDLVDPDLADQFRQDCLNDCKHHIRANRVSRPLTPEEVPDILARRLRIYGLSGPDALAALRGSDGSSPDASSKARPSGPAAEKLAAQAKGAGAAGPDRVQARTVRQAVAAATPAPGAGAARTALTPPPGQTVEQRVAWARANIVPKR